MAEFTPLSALFHAQRDRSAVVAYRLGVPVSLGDFEQQVRAWYKAFVDAPGSRYVLHSADSCEFAAALLGAWHASKCVLVPSDLQASSFTPHVPVDGFAGAQGGPMPRDPHRGELPALDEEAPLLEMFTSGSTGHPVAIPKCIRQLEREAAGLAATLQLGDPHARVVGTVSHQHMYGIMFRVLLPLTTGRAFEAVRLPQVQDLQRVDAPEGVVLVTSPAQLARLQESAALGSSVAGILSAGGPLSDEAVQSSARVFPGVPVNEIYGSSETGAVAWRLRSPGVAPAWHPLPAVQFRIDEGVLELRTPQLPDDNWFRSSDRVVEREGGFELAGRVDRIVKLEEQRVSLDAVERLLLATTLVQKVSALVLDGQRRVLAIAAQPTAAGWALMERGKRHLVDALQAALRHSAEVAVLPRSWRFVEPWPVTVDGKTPEALLRERFERSSPEFRVVQQDANACIAELWVSPTSIFFSGHFPEHPVLPGVAQIQWLVWLTRSILGVQADFAGLEAAKFRRVILPASRIRVSLQHDPAVKRTNYRILQGEELSASGRIRWS